MNFSTIRNYDSFQNYTPSCSLGITRSFQAEHIWKKNEPTKANIPSHPIPSC